MFSYWISIQAVEEPPVELMRSTKHSDATPLGYTLKPENLKERS